MREKIILQGIIMHKKGLVIGKFLPPHKGHEYLFKFAEQYCEQLYIVVDCIEGQSIMPSVRKDWIKKIMPHANVIALPNNMPQDPSDNPEFWPIWKNALYEAIGGKPDILIAAMDYGWELSQVLECEFTPCDIARESVPISATEIRANPLDNWKYIIDSAKPYFMKKVCLIGPESTGKTTCAIKLAQELDTVFVPEYAKSVIEKQNGQFFYNNVEQVATAQVCSENALKHMVNKIMICDSDVITTMIWSDILFGKHPKILDTIAQSQKYDLTLLFSPDVAWVDDQHRQCLPNAADSNIRWDFFYKMEEKLKQLDRHYVVINGSYENRFEQSLQTIHSEVFNRYKNINNNGLKL